MTGQEERDDEQRLPAHITEEDVALITRIVAPSIMVAMVEAGYSKHPKPEITDEVLDHAISRTRHRALRGEPAYPDDLETIIGAALQKRSGEEITDEGVARAVQVMLHEGLSGRTWPEYARAVLEAALWVPVGEGEQ